MLLIINKLLTFCLILNIEYSCSARSDPPNDTAPPHHVHYVYVVCCCCSFGGSGRVARATRPDGPTAPGPQTDHTIWGGGGRPQPFPRPYHMGWREGAHGPRPPITYTMYTLCVVVYLVGRVASRARPDPPNKHHHTTYTMYMLCVVVRSFGGSGRVAHATRPTKQNKQQQQRTPCRVCGALLFCFVWRAGSHQPKYTKVIRTRAIAKGEHLGTTHAKGVYVPNGSY
jgi:hypothetical protein